jgi:hypothetical protein
MKQAVLLSLFCLGCDPGVIIESRDQTTDALFDVDAALVPIVDASDCGNGNPGTGACFDPTKDCPPEDACWRFECVMGPGEIKVCGSVAKGDAAQ